MARPDDEAGTPFNAYRATNALIRQINGEFLIKPGISRVAGAAIAHLAGQGITSQREAIAEFLAQRDDRQTTACRIFPADRELADRANDLHAGVTLVEWIAAAVLAFSHLSPKKRQQLIDARYAGVRKETPQAVA